MKIQTLQLPHGGYAIIVSELDDAENIRKESWEKFRQDCGAVTIFVTNKEVTL